MGYHGGMPPPSTPIAASTIRVGVAGWSYPDWRGILYPRSRPRGFSELALVARLFDCVEINSTFYRYPEAPMAESWLHTVAARPDFVFTAKVPRDLTHEKEVGAEEIRAGGQRVLEGLDPLIGAGRLEVLLAQFPPFLRDGPAARARIEAIVEALRPVPVVVEIRNRSFLATGAGGGVSSFLPFLERIGAGFVNVDLPGGGESRASTPPPTTVNTSAIGYVRFHGRNTRTWFDRRAGRDEKYDYLYGAEELREWIPRIETLASRTLRTHVITNNHFRAQAPANALQLISLLDRPLPDLPATLVAQYPNLARPEASRASPAPPAEGSTGAEAANGAGEPA